MIQAESEQKQVYSELNPIVFEGPYSQVSMHRIAAFGKGSSQTTPVFLTIQAKVRKNGVSGSSRETM